MALLHNLLYVLKALFYWPNPSVPPEHRLKLSMGYRTRSNRRGRGWLILTKDHLMFERAVAWLSLARLAPSANFSVDLNDIVVVQPMSADVFDRSPFLPILAIALKSGEHLFVQLADRDAWIPAIEEAVVARTASVNHEGATPSPA
jgi:hypothetical protein